MTILDTDLVELLSDIVQHDVIILKGGPGSGHRGHRGRPGKRGGSMPGGGLGATPISNTDKELHAYLTTVADMKRNQKHKDFKYAGMEDVILKHGKFFEPPKKGDKLPPGCELGEPKDCFSNAIMNAVGHEDLTYTEGYAASSVLPGFGFPHAWLTTKDGKVIDPTWGTDELPPGTSYFGIQLDHDFVMETTLRTGMAGIIVNDWMDDSRLMKGGFPEGAIRSKEIGAVITKGGAGSGFRGHRGRPGKRGGSLPGTGGGSGVRVWQGKQHAKPDKKLSKLRTGELGEQLVMRAMEEKLGAKFSTMNNGINNAPIDVAGNHHAIEVKTGLASNGRTAQHWRATIGQPGKKETELLKQMSKEEKRAHNQWKGQKILDRKNDMLKEMEKTAGAKIKPATVGVIMSPDGSRGDVYLIPGFHLRLPWKDYAIEEYHIGTYDVGELKEVFKGGPGSGHRGHRGRPGKRGGSLPGRRGAGGREVIFAAKSKIKESGVLEKEVTPMLNDLATEHSSKMVGLEFRMKTEESLARKIRADMEEKDISAEEAADTINDAVRYTMVVDSDSFGSDVAEIQNSMAEQGWNQYDSKFKNYYAPGDAYDGYNTVVVNNKGQRFELQFHTKESFRIKTAVHVLYVEARTVTNPARRAELVDQMTALWGDYQRPNGWQDLKGIKI